MEAEWYKIRELFWGDNYGIPDVKHALELAKCSKHPDAIWLTQAFQNVNISEFTTHTQWFDHFMLLDQNDPRTLTFAWHCQRDLAGLLKHAADMGYAWAQALYEIYFAKGTKYAESACKQGEREGFYALARYCRSLRKEETYLSLYRKAADLNHIDSMIAVGDYFGRMQFCQEAIKWYGRVAVVANKHFYFVNYCWGLWNVFDQSNKYMAGKYAKAVFKQRVLKPNMQKEKWKCMKHAANFFDEQNLLCRLAVNAWSICAKRLNIIKDMRIYIAKYVWKSRKLGLFPVDPQ